MGKMDGKVGVVTGGAAGLGAAVTELYCREGAKVAFCDMNEEAGQKKQAELRDKGLDASYICVNVTIAADNQRFIAKAVELYGGIDAVACCAGIMRHGMCHTHTEEDWDLVVNTDLRGPWLCCKYAIPHMMEKGGTIVIVASMASDFYIKDQIAYQVAKAGAKALGKSIAAEYGAYNIRSNVVRPGGILTGMAAYAMHGNPPEVAQRSGKWNKLIRPLHGGRSATAEEMAKSVLFLSCDDSIMCTGAEILADGGLTLGLPVLGLAKEYDFFEVEK